MPLAYVDNSLGTLAQLNNSSATSKNFGLDMRLQDLSITSIELVRFDNFSSIMPRLFDKNFPRKIRF